MRITLIIFFLTAVLSGPSMCQEGALPASADKTEQKIDALLRQMTVEEKISQVTDGWGSTGIPRLGVPALLKTEGLHSQSYSTGATLFPHAIAMAATFDPNLIEQVGRQTAVEAKAAHIRSSWSPVLDVVRDVRWGRTEETYGESPYLVSRMGVAWIDGFQSLGMVAVPKHFAGHGQPMGGRDSHDIGLSDRVMREIHLPSFRAAIEDAHAGGIMAAYGLWNGVPDNASTVLLQNILRQEWGFDGFVVSDCGGPEHFITKHAIAQTPEQAAALAVAAGVNMECGSIYKAGIEKALAKELMTEAQLDDIVRPVLRAKFRLGLFEHPEPPNMVWEKLPAYDTPQSRALALKVEQEGAVLLRNDNHILPLNRNLKTIAVIGPNSDTAQTGDYSPKPAPGQLITVLQGIKSRVGPSTRVVYAAGLTTPQSKDTSGFVEAAAAARQSDVAIVVVGDESHEGAGSATTGENHDGATLDLPGAQRDLIKQVAATGVPVILVIVNGKPFTLAWEAEHIPGILVTWYPGEEGGDATADLLFGLNNPSGRLPITWPRSAAQLPLTYDYHPSGRRYDYYDMPFTPQYRFGYGLSYAKFSYANLQIVPKADDPGFVTVSADVRNIGDRDGDEVAQLYVTDLVASVSTPVIQLLGVQRLSLKAGEKKTATFQLTPYQLSLLDAKMVRRVEPGTFRIHVGGVSPAAPPNLTDERKAKVGFTSDTDGVSGEFNEPKAYSAHFVLAMEAPEKVEGGREFPVKVSISNDGNLTDVTEAKLFNDFEIGSRSFELRPGQSSSHTFDVAMYRPGSLALIAASQMVAKSVAVTPSAPKVTLRNPRLDVDTDDVMTFTATALNMGSAPYQGTVPLKVDGKTVQDVPVALQSGEKRDVSASYTFASSGLHHIEFGDLAERQVAVAGGIGLALRNPLAHLDFDEGHGTATHNEVTGKEMQIEGGPKWIPGKDGSALELTASHMGVNAQNADLYRKAFTLSAWVMINRFADNGDIALFGGSAPMGADQDNSGTVLNAGIRNKKLFLGFQGNRRDVSGNREVPTGKWLNLTYTYDPSIRKGSLYIDGELDKSGTQEPYTGPLEIIGDSPTLQHGNFSIDDVLILQSSLSPALVKTLAHEGFGSLLRGEFISDWRSFRGSAINADVTADIPGGSRISLVIEVQDSAGKIAASAPIQISPGTPSYKLPQLKSDDKIRFRAHLDRSASNDGPTLRAITLSGQAGEQRWSTPRQWSAGKADTSIAVNQEEQ